MDSGEDEGGKGEYSFGTNEKKDDLFLPRMRKASGSGDISTLSSNNLLGAAHDDEDIEKDE